MRFLCEVGYYLSAGATALLLGLTLCLLNPRNAYADPDPGPDAPTCKNEGLARKCDLECSASPMCKGMNLCKTTAKCVDCECRLYKWGDPINGYNCECQVKAKGEEE
jgi:hypothetical protein